MKFKSLDSGDSLIRSIHSNDDNLTSSMHWPDEGKNEISYQQQPAPKHQYKTYRDDSESDGGSTNQRPKSTEPNSSLGSKVRKLRPRDGDLM